MALIVSAANGNFNAEATWVGGVVPGVGDEARSSHTVTITADVTCDKVSNTASGTFVLSNNVTLTANVVHTSANSSSYVVRLNASAPAQAWIVGDCTGSGSAVNSAAVANLSTGTLHISGILLGGSIGSNAVAALNNSTGTLNITTANCTGGSGTASNNAALNNSTGTLNITGNCTGGGNATSFGAANGSTGTMLVVGTIQASEFAAGVGGTNRQQTTLLTGPFLISTTFGVNPIACTAWRWATALNDQTYLEVGTQTLLEKRNLVTPDNATNFPTASDVRSGTAYGIGGVLEGTCVVPNPAQVAAGSPVDDTVGTLAAATAGEIATAVRSELSVELGRLDASVSSRLAPSGTLATVTTLTNAPTVPTPSQIASQVRTELGTELGRIDTTISSRLAPNGTLATVTTLTNAPSVPSAAAIADEVRVELATELARIDAPISGAGNAPSASTVATAVRTELATELARVDAAISTRLADADYVAPANSDVAAVKAVTDALNTERLANVATTAIVGNLIAQANS
jgi:hypothetical protein